LGVAGGIMAYKALKITGQLRDRFAGAYGIMTKAASKLLGYRPTTCGREGWGRLAKIEVFISKLTTVSEEIDERILRQGMGRIKIKGGNQS